MPDDKVDDVLFIVVDQLNRGGRFIEEENERNQLALLNLRAGEKAMAFATFLGSASYLKAGIDVLRYDQWKKQYDLSLQLHSLYAEAEYCNGHFHEVGRVAGIVIKQATVFENKFRVYVTLIKSLAGRNMLQDAINLGMNVLAELGVECPSSPLPKTFVKRDMMELKVKLEKTADAEFLNYREMTDAK
eukprot:12598575-Ditylum_brightwellii.AAC.1